MSNLVVLISGNGSNLQAILDACASGQLPARVAAVVSNQPDAFGLERARRAGVPANARPKPRTQDRREYDAELADLVASHHPDWIVLAGWMRILTSAFLARFPDRVVNLHPALPGAFSGAHAIERAFDAYRRGEIQHTGVMVHLVPDEGVDAGPVLMQEIVPIHPDDSLESLETRIHTVEHRLLVETLNSLCQPPTSNLQPLITDYRSSPCPTPFSPSTTKPASSNSRADCATSTGGSSPQAARPNFCARIKLQWPKWPTTPARPKSSAGG